MKTAFAYARVSTKEQEQMKNSIPEQIRRINEFAEKENIKIINLFHDSDSAFHDENREQFALMINTAIKERPTYIIFDDSSRLARTKQVAIDTKKQIRSYGIEVLYASEPNIDSNTVAGFWMESIQEIKNEATSIEIGFNTFRGMSGNLKHRDDETGWCYKNGGKAPYGYKREILYRGMNSKGKPIYKTIWVLNEDTWEIARKIIVDMYTNREMSYTQIRDYLNTNNIKNPNGKFWSTSTISSMLKKDRLEQYTGTAIWNKENKKVKGIKYNNKDKWVICENAHPSIITREEFERAIKRKERYVNTAYIYKPSSDYLLTGKNIENNFMFTCANCGGHIVGSSIGKSRKRTYCCSNNRNKGNYSCNNNFKLEKDFIEDKILSIIEENYICDKNIEIAIEDTYKKIISSNNDYSNEVKKYEQQIKSLDNEMQNLLNAVKSGLNSEVAITEINNVKANKDEKVKELEMYKQSMKNSPKITKDDIKKYFYDIRNIFYNSDIQEKKELLKTFVYSISMSSHQIEIIFYFSGVQTVGADSGNRTRVISLEG